MTKNTMRIPLALLVLGAVCVTAVAQGVSFTYAQSTVGSGWSSPQAQQRSEAEVKPRGLSSLPAAAQGPISAALGRDDLRYWLHASAGRLHGENPEHSLAVDFTRQGVEIRSKTARLGLAVRGYGYGDTLLGVSNAAPQAKANRVQYGRGTLTEWYINGPHGLEQGFTLAKPPGKANGRPLTVALALSGDLTAGVEAGGAALTLRGPDGQAALRLAGLTAYDATGRELRGRFALRGGELRLQVDDAGAKYPLVVDPFVQQAELTASDGASVDFFGVSVALSGAGTTALVGAAGNNSFQGAAYVFTLSSGTWSQQPKLTASDGAGNDQFGVSVALSGAGTTALVGAAFKNASQGAAYVFEAPLPFSVFSARLETFARPTPAGFDLTSTFTLGNQTNGINPLTENVVLTIGTFSTSVPAGSFKETAKGRFVFQGVINGVALQIQIVPLGGNKFQFKAAGTGIDLTSLANPVTVTVTIGDDGGTTNVTANK